MPRSGRFTLRCKACREHFDGDAAALERIGEPPPPEPERPPNAPEAERAPQKPAVPVTATPSRKAPEGLVLWWAHVVVCGVATGLAGWAATDERGEAWMAPVLLGLVWTGASGLGALAHRRGRRWARAFGVAVAQLQIVAGLAVLVLCGFAGWEVLEHDRIPWNMRPIFAFGQPWAVGLQAALAIALLSISDRSRLRLRDAARSSRGPASGPEGAAEDSAAEEIAGGLLLLATVGLVGVAWSADFHGVPRVTDHRGYGWIPGLLGLIGVVRTAPILVGSERGLPAAIVAAAVVGGLWGWSAWDREATASASLAALETLKESCRDTAAGRRDAEFARSELSEAARAEAEGPSTTAAARAATDPRFGRALEASWRRLPPPKLAPADLNFCQPYVIRALDHQLRHHR